MSDEQLPALGTSASLPPVIPCETADVVKEIASLRLRQDFAEMSATDKCTGIIRVGKPKKDAFIRVCPSPASWFDCLVLDAGIELGLHVVSPTVGESLAGEPTVSPRRLYLAADRRGNLFFWPIKLKGPRGGTDDWTQSAHALAEVATRWWIRVTADLQAGSYVGRKAINGQGWAEPTWPDEPIERLIERAFNGKIIRDLNHAAIRHLNGEDA